MEAQKVVLEAVGASLHLNTYYVLKRALRMSPTTTTTVQDTSWPEVFILKEFFYESLRGESVKNSRCGYSSQLYSQFSSLSVLRSMTTMLGRTLINFLLRVSSAIAVSAKHVQIKKQLARVNLDYLDKS